MNSRLVLLGIIWLAYFVIHSLLASLRVKRGLTLRFPGIMPYYRLGFNAIATVLLVFPLWLIVVNPGAVIWKWTGALVYLSNGLALLAVAGFLYSLRYYDGSEFFGLRQLAARQLCVEDQEHLCISPLHRYMRHPWYFFALIMIWTRDMTPEWFLSAVLLSAYFILGSRLEERKLVAYYGGAYREYLQRVPGVFPLPWRYLDAQDARRIESMGGGTGKREPSPDSPGS